MPLLDGPDARAALAVVRGLAAELASPIGTDLATTHLGLATFLSYVERAEIADTTALAELHLDRGIRLVVESRLGHSLARGWTGVGWMVDHIVAADLANELCRTFDHTLHADLAVEHWTGNYDLLRGLAGLGIYALARRHGELGPLLAERVLFHLEALAEWTDTGCRWFTRPGLLFDEELAAFPQGRYDYGVSHGIAGVIGVLARFVAAGIDPDRSGHLLEASVSHLLASAPPRQPSRFPVCVTTHRHELTQLAWCYGDFGITLVLMAAARAAGRKDWEGEALALAHQMAARSVENETIDTGLCHGTAGIAHGFHRLYYATRDVVFADTARRWFRRTLGLRRPDLGLAGYSKIHPASGRKVEASILAGSTGTALALLAAATDVEPEWDELMLFGLAPEAATAQRDR